jgi:hypothetical protein
LSPLSRHARTGGLGGKPNYPRGHCVCLRVVFIPDCAGQCQETASLKMSLTLSARRPLTNCCWSGSCCFAPRSISRKLVDRILPLVVSNNPVDQFLANRPGCKTRFATLGLIFAPVHWICCCVCHARPSGWCCARTNVLSNCLACHTNDFNNSASSPHGHDPCLQNDEARFGILLTGKAKQLDKRAGSIKNAPSSEH